MISRRAMLAGMGGLPFTRPDQHYEPPAGGAQIPGARGLIRAREVIIVGTGPNSGIFVYSPTASAGHLIASITAGSGTDPFGNAFLNGVTSYSSSLPPIAVTEQNGVLALYSAATEAGPWTLDANLQLSGVGGDLTLANLTAGSNVVIQAGTGARVSLQPVAGRMTVQDTVTAAQPILDVFNLASSITPIVRATINALGDLALGVRVSGDTNSRIVADVTAGGAPRIRFGSGSAAPDVNLSRVNANQLQVTAGDFDAATVGRGFQVAEGTNAKQGTATLAAGTVTVANTSVTANSRIFLTAQTTGAAPGALRVSARTAGTSFVITSTSATDTSLVAYEIFEPG